MISGMVVYGYNNHIVEIADYIKSGQKKNAGWSVQHSFFTTVMLRRLS